ncbi:MAG: DUF4150 domain-containing protein [Polyangiales bacterium]
MAEEKEGACKVSEAIVVSMYPDVCLKDGKPVPYDLVGKSSDDVRHSPDVRYTEAFALNKGSRLSTCYGDDPASAGVQSGVVKGMCRPVDDFANNVNVNGLPAVRHDTKFEMNTAGPDGAHNTEGKVVYVRDTSDTDDEFERKRKATLEKLKADYGKPDFYKHMAELDPANADKWNQMAEIQERFRAGESGYDAATKAYSESMRETLHQSTINMLEDPAGLRSTMGQSQTGLYDWYIRMHGTAFNENGAWNSDFITRGVGVMGNTDPRMAWNAGQLARGMWQKENDPYAKAAADAVRERRKKKGLRVTARPGEKLAPENDEEKALRERLQREKNERDFKRLPVFVF